MTVVLPWRLIESPPSDIASHMALDRELFEAFVNDPEAPPLLRIYRVSKPGISVGYSHRRRTSVIAPQGGYPDPLKETLMKGVARSPNPKGLLRGGGTKPACRQAGQSPVRRLLRALRALAMTGKGSRCASPRNDLTVRPTGGGLVRHGNDLLYTVIARRDTFPTFHQVRTSYLSFHEAVQEAFQKRGVETELLRCDEAKRHTGLEECFRAPVATDILLDKKKVAGGAQRRRGPCFLHQGSVQLVRGISYEALKTALTGSFEKKFAVSWEPT